MVKAGGTPEVKQQYQMCLKERANSVPEGVRQDEGDERRAFDEVAE